MATSSSFISRERTPQLSDQHFTGLHVHVLQEMTKRKFIHETLYHIGGTCHPIEPIQLVEPESDLTLIGDVGARLELHRSEVIY